MKVERISKGGLKVTKTVKVPRKKRIDLERLTIDLPLVELEELQQMELFFMIYSHYSKTNDFYVPDIREALRMCVKEMINRGIYEPDTELPNWKGDSNELS